MKYLAIITCTLLLVVSCDKSPPSTNDSEKPSSHTEAVETPTDQVKQPESSPEMSKKAPDLDSKESNDKAESYMKTLEEEAKYLKRIKDLKPFEEALEPRGYNSVASAFIVRLDRDKKPSLGRILYGRAPTDYEVYLVSVRPSTSYLVGAVMSESGYSIYPDRKEYRYCIPLTKDEKSTDGGGLTRSYSIVEVERLLKK